jgi:chordin
MWYPKTYSTTRRRAPPNVSTTNFRNPTLLPNSTVRADYSALLTERSSLVLKNDYKLISNNQNKNNVVATGRFSFHKKNLYFSFYISDKAARPRSLQFADSEGNILEEFQLSRAGGLVNSLYQNATRKVCGVWRRVPHEYRKRFRQEKMYVVLVWGGDFTLSGQVMKYAALATENFSSLLEPSAGTSSQMTGAGGTAMVSFSTSVSTSIYLAVVFNGLFGADDVADVPLNVTLSLDDKKYILQEVPPPFVIFVFGVLHVRVSGGPRQETALRAEHDRGPFACDVCRSAPLDQR